METDREQLRTIYNRDFKIRYGPAHSPALNRGPSSPPRPLRRGHPSRPGSGGTQLPQWRWLVPGRRRPPLPRGAHAPPAPPGARPLCPRRAPAPSPRGKPPAQSLPRRPGPGSGSCGHPLLEGGLGDCAGHGGGERRVGGRGRRASAGRSFLLVAASPGAGCTGIPAPLLRGCFFGSPLSQKRPSVGGRISGSSERRKGHQLRMYQTSISTCGFFSMETQGQGRSPGSPSTLWWKEGCLGPILGAIQVKIKETSLYVKP